MKTNKKRLQRIEELLHEEDGLTAADVELILSALPPEYSKAVRAKLLEIADKECAAPNDVRQDKATAFLKEVQFDVWD